MNFYVKHLVVNKDITRACTAQRERRLGDWMTKDAGFNFTTALHFATLALLAGRHLLRCAESHRGCQGRSKRDLLENVWSTSRQLSMSGCKDNLSPSCGADLRHVVEACLNYSELATNESTRCHVEFPGLAACPEHSTLSLTERPARSGVVRRQFIFSKIGFLCSAQKACGKWI